VRRLFWFLVALAVLPSAAVGGMWLALLVSALLG